MAALVMALACSKCSDGGEWCKESRGKKSGRKEKGERRVSSPSLPALSTSFSFARFSLHRPTLSERLELGAFLAPADSAVAVRKNDSKAINVLR